MRLFALLFVAFCAASCGGSTTTDTSSSNSQNTCGGTSGVACLDCVAKKCCAELSACTGDAEGKAYETCVANCAFDHDAGGCESSCAALHPTGESVCAPYTTCADDKCLTVGCK
jgi:hypothetical protein